MSRVVQSESRFRQLLADGFLPASQCGDGFLSLSQPLLDAGVLHWGRTGAGRRLVVQDQSVLADFVAKQYPTSGSVAQESFRRVEAVARFRDSKALANNAPEVLLLRAWRDDVLAVRGQAVHAATATSAHGVFAFAISDDYRLRGQCALIENPALFFSFERLDLNIPVAFLSCGFASSQLLQWLARGDLGPGAVLHLPDYDPIGLWEFLRIYAILGDRVLLHIPPDLNERFRRYSKPALLQPLKSSDILRRVRNANHPAVTQVLHLIDHHGAGLEQEALLLS